MSRKMYLWTLVALFAALAACLVLAVIFWPAKDLPLENGWPTWRHYALSGSIIIGVFVIAPAIVANLCRKETPSGDVEKL